MMSNCQIISEMIPEYINKNTTAKQNAEIVHHIALCSACRIDFLMWLSVERLLQQTEKAPSINFQVMFDKVSNNEKETELERIIKRSSYNIAFEIIRYIFSTVKSTYRLAGLIKGGK